MSDPRLARIEELTDSFFPPQLRAALTLLLRHDLVRTDRKLGPFLRAAMHANPHPTNLYEAFEDRVPLTEAASLLLAFRCLEERVRLSVAGSHPDLDRVLSSRDVHATVEAAFEELAKAD